MVTITTIALSVLLSLGQAGGTVSADQKQQFIDLLHKLPHKGEFFTDEAVTAAQPHLGILLALTEEDLKDQDIYPYLAISRGLFDREVNRTYVVQHFGEARDSYIKLFWAALLFDAEVGSSEITQYLRGAVDSPEGTLRLRELLGPRWDSFREKLAKQP